ncbi:hypothetical protein [Corallococcus silvisoli]|uniref:hypothetical protein n=1 Tax=Corallococcus silvisoli TaxID=2697031 RepID=UPI001378CDDA|nr:hypothetical protein [Corallococcus silvisoli]NBD11820.1 hypothetical protein [Corallococcus silvisoli]
MRPWERIARAALKSRHYYRRLADSLMNGDFDCPGCGCLTNNGICTGCRYDTSPMALLKKRVAELEVAATQRPGLLLRADASGRVNVQVRSKSLVVQSGERIAVRLRLAFRFLLTGRMELANAVSTFPDVTPEAK